MSLTVNDILQKIQANGKSDTSNVLFEHVKASKLPIREISPCEIDPLKPVLK